MRKSKLFLFLAVSIFLFTACSGKTSVDDRRDSEPESTSYDSQVEKQTEIQIELQTKEEMKEETQAQTKEETRSGVPESGQTGGNHGPAAYEEYLNSLQYLDEMEAKLSEAITTVDMVDASKEALEAWDKELNKIYALLMEELSAEQREELKRIQRLWIKERDEAAAQGAGAFEGGTFAQVAYVDSLCQSTKKRTLELAAIYCSGSDDFSFDINSDSGIEESDTDPLKIHQSEGKEIPIPPRFTFKEISESLSDQNIFWEAYYNVSGERIDMYLEYGEKLMFLCARQEKEKTQPDKMVLVMQNQSARRIYKLPSMKFMRDMVRR